MMIGQRTIMGRVRSAGAGPHYPLSTVKNAGRDRRSVRRITIPEAKTELPGGDAQPPPVVRQPSRRPRTESTWSPRTAEETKNR